MIMKHFLATCDLCAVDGRVRLATGVYKVAGDLRFHACNVHLEQVTLNGCKVLRRFDLPGDAKAEHFSE